MKSVDELTQEELSELRDRLFHQMTDDGSLDEVFETEVTSGEEIPMDFVKAHYSGTYFVEEDFWCNTQD